MGPRLEPSGALLLDDLHPAQGHPGDPHRPGPIGSRHREAQRRGVGQEIRFRGSLLQRHSHLVAKTQTQNLVTLRRALLVERRQDNRRHLGLLHLRLHSELLPENPPRHEGSGDHQQDSEIRQHDLVDSRQVSHERSRLLLLHRVYLQRLVHHRVPHTFHRQSIQLRVHSQLGQRHRHDRHPQFLHRLGPAQVRLPPGERRHSGVPQHHPHHEALQIDQAFVGPQNPHTDVQGLGQGTYPAGVLPGAGYRRVRQFGLLRGADPIQSKERFQEHTSGPVVGPGNHDHRGLRGHGPKNLHRDVCGGPVCPSGCVDHCTASAGYREQFRDVLRAHAGPSKTAQEETEGPARGTAQGEATRGDGATRQREFRESVTSGIGAKQFDRMWTTTQVKQEFGVGFWRECTHEEQLSGIARRKIHADGLGKGEEEAAR